MRMQNTVSLLIVPLQYRHRAGGATKNLYHPW